MHTSRAVLALSLFTAPAFADSITKSTTETSAPAELEISAGAYHDNRSLTATAENPSGLTFYTGIPHEGASLQLATYPIRHTHTNGWISSGGLSLGVGRSVGANVTYDDLETVATIDVHQTHATAALHHRLTAWRISVDSQVGFGHARYSFGNNMPRSFEVPNTAQSYVSAGVQAGVDVFRGVTVAAGAQVLAGIGDAGQMSEAEWYGEGQTFGNAFDASVTVPLPKGVFVRAAFARRSLTTTLEGTGLITEMEGVSKVTDTTLTGGLQVGLRR